MKNHNHHGAKNQRTLIIPKRTQVRAQHHASYSKSSLPNLRLTLDRCIIGLGYASLATYLYHNIRKSSPSEICGISAGSLLLGYSLFDLGKSTQFTQAPTTNNTEARRLDRAIDADGVGDKDDWKGDLKGRELGSLKPKEKVLLLKSEEQRIRDAQAHEQFLCGKAYIKKVAYVAYVAYGRRGGYGGPDWKRYSETDNECQDMYNKHQKQQRRLVEIMKELSALDAEL